MVQQLQRLGVGFRNALVERLDLRGGRIASARLRGERGQSWEIQADWFICAAPVERGRGLWTKEILETDPALRLMHELRTEWMNGIQLYLRERVLLETQWPPLPGSSPAPRGRLTRLTP